MTVLSPPHAVGGPGGTGNSLLVYIADSSEYVGAIRNTYGGEFRGLISDTPFTSVKLIGATGLHQQNYRLDDMVYSSVPEPSSLCLLSGGLIGVFLFHQATQDHLVMRTVATD